MERKGEFKKFTIRMPDEVRAWLAVQVNKNASTLGSEVIRSCSERMERTAEPASILTK